MLYNIINSSSVDAEIHHNKVEVKEFKIKNKYLDKSHIYNCANYRAFDGDSDVLRSLSLESFNSIRDKERYKRIVEKAKYYLNRN